MKLTVATISERITYDNYTSKNELRMENVGFKSIVRNAQIQYRIESIADQVADGNENCDYRVDTQYPISY